MKPNSVELSNITKTKYPDFAERLNTAMWIRDCSNLRLAHKTYVSPSAISSYRCGARQPSFEVLRSIALALNVSTDFLLGLNDYMDMSPAELSRKKKKEEKCLQESNSLPT